MLGLLVRKLELARQLVIGVLAQGVIKEILMLSFILANRIRHEEKGKARSAIPACLLFVLSAVILSPLGSGSRAFGTVTGSQYLLEDTVAFHLPPKSIFDPAMPRYPNIWFYVETSLAQSYQAAVKLVTENLRRAMRLREFHGPFSNPEGCDFEVRLEHLQPWENSHHKPLQHSHAFHMRYYYSALESHKLERVKVKAPGVEGTFFRFAASAHYEVEHTNPNHADVEICPICGRTREYSHLEGNLVELVHDPLGLELVLTGKIRGETIRFEDWEQHEVGSIEGLQKKFSVQKFVFPGRVGDRNTLRIGIVVLTPKEKASP
ncbi:MAG: hypothetical protein ACE1Z2_07100 [Acidobacteriota bacterium]